MDKGFGRRPSISVRSTQPATRSRNYGGRHRKNSAGCRTISRFLCPYGRQSFLWAAHYCTAQATYPEVKRSGPLLLPYLVLLHVGFSLPAELLLPRCALTAPFHPYRAWQHGGIFSVALSVSVKN